MCNYKVDRRGGERGEEEDVILSVWETVQDISQPTVPIGKQLSGEG